MHKLKKIKGFTLIELMIVVAIIGILATVAIPKFGDMLEKAREGATKGNIGAIMSSVSIYSANNNGKWPGDISDLQYAAYISPLPAVKVTHSFGGTPLSGKNNEVEIVSDVVDNGQGKSKGNAYGKTKFKNDGDGWRYDPDTGEIWVNNAQTDSRGTYYTYYGYE